MLVPAIQLAEVTLPAEKMEQTATFWRQSWRHI
jgi:hypothetical protein